MDLTVGAVPFYFSSMGLEAWLLKRRADREGPSSSDYERDDTLANLAMGLASLTVPLATRALSERIAPQRSRVGKGLIALAAGAVVVTTFADRKARRAESIDDYDQARAVARVGGPTAIVAGGIAATTALATATASGRAWGSTHRRGRDLGTGAVALVVAIAGWDFIYYWNHRFQHETRFMWAYHVAHHSSERYNLSTALRQPVAEMLGAYVPFSALCLVGVRPELIEKSRQINLLYQYWIHTDVIDKIGPAEEVLNSASHHRVHHGSNSRYIDRNHGSILILWDRLFRTFQREDPDDPVVYGLTRNIRSFNPVRIMDHEYVDIIRDVADSTNWRDRLSFVFRGPGWAYARRAEMSAGTGPAAAATNGVSSLDVVRESDHR